MQRCMVKICENCNCVRRVAISHVANANFAPVARPSNVMRRDPLTAAKALEKRLKGSMKILS